MTEMTYQFIFDNGGTRIEDQYGREHEIVLKSTDAKKNKVVVTLGSGHKENFEADAGKHLTWRVDENDELEIFHVNGSTLAMFSSGWVGVRHV